jgi:formylglycine-generating enzyme required for sulfatase activity
MSRQGLRWAVFTIAVVLAATDSVRSQSKLPTSLKGRDGAEMILIPGGRFVFGRQSDATERLVRSLGEEMLPSYETELPEKTMELPDFYIDKYEVTNELYARFLSSTKHSQGRLSDYKSFSMPRQPIVGIGWNAAEAYCGWAGKRLPTEIEWEKAARGADRRTWPWGDQREETRFNGRTASNRGPVEVGSFPAGDSPYGVSDMAGNVWEMTTSHWPNESSKSRVMRGGSYRQTLAGVRVTVRWAAQNEETGATWLGFRCVMDPRGRG